LPHLALAQRVPRRVRAAASGVRRSRSRPAPACSRLPIDPEAWGRGGGAALVRPIARAGWGLIRPTSGFLSLIEQDRTELGEAQALCEPKLQLRRDHFEGLPCEGTVGTSGLEPESSPSTAPSGPGRSRSVRRSRTP